MPSLTCQKCGSKDIRKAKVPRLSGCLVAIGYTLWIPAALLLLVALLMTFGLVGAAGSVASETSKESKEKAIAQLQKIGVQDITEPGLVQRVPPSLLETFRKQGSIPETQVEALRPAVRDEVKRVLAEYDLSRAGEAAGTGLAVAAGGLILVLLYAISLPTVIIGLLLTLKKKIWRCKECGFPFDRT